MNAGVAQLVERILAKDKVAGSKPVTRSKSVFQKFCSDWFLSSKCHFQMAKMAG